jgi:transposase-like protein
VAENLDQNTLNLPVKLMFQDEARFGRLSDPRRCWAPAPLRPMVGLALVRQYTYAYAAVAPQDGALDWMLAPKMDTMNIAAFLNQVSQQHPNEFILMVIDGAPSHRSQRLPVPNNMALVRLPPYSPELNPVEHLWDEIREKEFGNRVFDSLGAAMAQAVRGLKRFQNSPAAVRSLTGWNWILSSL